MGYVSKSEGAAVLVQALRTVARGERHLTPDLSARVATYERRCDSGAIMNACSKHSLPWKEAQRVLKTFSH